MTSLDPAALYPAQVCFVVDHVERATAECVSRFDWGPFHQFSARVEEAEQRGWRGTKRTDAALGMAGGVQVELIRVHYDPGGHSGRSFD